MKNEQHETVGLFVFIPIDHKSMKLLEKAPISKHYFQALSKKELESLREATQPVGYFAYHIDQWGDHTPPARSTFFQFLMKLMVRGGLFINSSPLKLSQDTVINMGFEEIPGAVHYDYGPEYLSHTYHLDLRGEKHKLFFDRLLGRE